MVETRQEIDFSRVSNAARESADIAGDASGVTATATGQDVIVQVQIDLLTENILQTLVIALVVILALMIVLYRVKEGTASLGALTVLPIGMVVAWVFAAMFLLDVPLTLFTALLMSLAIGLGTDYTIHISERFAQELEGTRKWRKRSKRLSRGLAAHCSAVLSRRLLPLPHSRSQHSPRCASWACW